MAVILGYVSTSGKVVRLWLVLGVLVVLALASSSSAAGVWFSPEGCEFEVQFPHKPKVEKQYVAGAGYLSTAVGGTRGNREKTVMLVAEAVPIDLSSLSSADRRAFLRERSRQYAEFNGLEHVEYETQSVKYADVISFRGGKKVGGIQVLYAGKIVLGKSSVLMLRGGGAAVSFPQKGLLEFMASVRPKKRK